MKATPQDQPEWIAQRPELAEITDADRGGGLGFHGDASKEVCDAHGRHRRRHCQGQCNGFHLNPKPPSTADHGEVPSWRLRGGK